MHIWGQGAALVVGLAAVTGAASAGASDADRQAAQPAGTGAFIRVREAVICDGDAGYWRQMAPELKDRYFLARWTEERLRRHLEMLKAFGFNSIQIVSIPWIATLAGVEPDAWQSRRLFLAQTAHELGLSVSQFVWGTCVDNGKGGFPTMDWHRPEERATLEAMYREQAVLAPHVDRVVTHWVDPGGPKCPQCNLDSVVEKHNAIMAAFRARNPRIRGALSTWFMSDKVYAGYTGPGSVANHPRLDRDTDVVIGVMTIGADGRSAISAVPGAFLDAVAVAGRPAGIWCWYTADNEIQPSLYVRTDVLQHYFRGLPPQTPDKLAWHSLDANTHGLNMPSLFVAGHLMRDPALDAQKLLDAFVEGFVGRANAPAFAAALRAVELARTRSVNYSQVTAPWLAECTAAVNAALHGLTSIKLAPGFQPAWPVTMTPADYLDELVAQLDAIRQMLVFLNAAEEIGRMQGRGATVEELRAAIDALPPVVYDPKHAAGLESFHYARRLSQLKTNINAKPKP
ncbi:MAG: hypothetical protein PHR35_01800 [Kiritimatiellae bacterium]|nr:hypothetical protein [Kiritimatiellia bacterium]